MASSYAAFLASNPELGVPMAISGFNRLCQVDVQGVKQAYYPKRDFFFILNVIRYKGFRNDLNYLNPGMILGRQVTEAMFLRLLIKYFRRWPASELTARVGAGNEVRAKQMKLMEAFAQRKGEEVEAYWARRAVLCPGLDIEDIPDDTDDDHAPFDEDYNPLSDVDEEEAREWRERRTEELMAEREERAKMAEDTEMGDAQMGDVEMGDAEIGDAEQEMRAQEHDDRERLAAKYGEMRV